jgi:intein/homing endonuclease
MAKDKKQDSLQQKEDLLRELTEFSQVFNTDAEIAEEETLFTFTSQARSETPAPPEPAKSPKNPYGLHDIITFCEHSYFLGQTLTPMQKIILKAWCMGSEGNQHLHLTNEITSDCSGCAWDYVRAKEEELSKITLGDGVYKLPPGKVPSENSPCLNCIRFCAIARAKRFEQLKYEAINDFELEDVKQREEAELVDRFESEMMLLEREGIPQKTRDQIVRKLGRTFTEMILVMGRRSGKALELNTPVLTTNGWSTMGQLKVGDYVYGEDGVPTRIVAVSPVWENRECFEVEFTTGEVIIADAAHEWTVSDKNARKHKDRYNGVVKTQTLETRELAQKVKIGKEYNWAIDVAMPLNKKSVELPINPYTLGVWLGDGTSQNGFITCYEHEIMQRILDTGEFEKVKPHTSNPNLWTCFGLKTKLKTLGLLANKHIPDVYFCGSLEQRLELIRGLVDTDGHVDAQGYVEIVSVHEQLARDIYALVASVGLKVKLHKDRAVLNGVDCGLRYRVSFCPYGGMKIAHLERKQSNCKPKVHTLHSSHRIRDIRPCNEKHNTVCIEVDNKSHLFLVGRSMIPTHNSYLVAILALYAVYRLIKMEHPQKAYGLMDFDIITVLNVAKSEDQAKGAVFEKIFSLVLTSPFFGPFVAHYTQTTLHFMTPRDLEEHERRKRRGITEKKGTIHLISGHSNSSSLVGKTVVVLIIDEMAEMAGKKGDDGKDKELYEKLKKSLATFGSDGKTILLSNPLYETGEFYRLYETSFSRDHVLMFQVPTEICNPTVEKSYLEQERKDSPESYSMHFEAQFASSSKDPFLPPDVVAASFLRLDNIGRTEIGKPGVSYFAHLDPAYNSDMYVLALVHAEPMKDEKDKDGRPLMEVIVDHIHIWRPKDKHNPINPEIVNQYVIDLSKRFNIAQVTYDHWNSESSIWVLKSHGINADKRVFSPGYQDMIFQNLKDLMMGERIHFYGLDTWTQDKEGVLCLQEITEAKKQFTYLEKVIKHNRPKIQAPYGINDDIVDAVSAAAFECINTKQYKSIARPRGVRMPRAF